MTTQENVTDAVFLYLGIFDAYEAISTDLIGENVLQEEVLPRMIYYVRNFLPGVIKSHNEEEIIEELDRFITDLRDKVYRLQSKGGDFSTVTMQEIWELRAAIFGFENVFLDILGEDVIENYVNPRVGEILGAYLPKVFKEENLSFDERLDMFSEFIKENNFVKEANFSYNAKTQKVEYRVNRCAFASIHSSSAYLDGQTRLCPWAMISSAIVSSSIDTNNKIQECKFTTRGSITKLEILEEDA